MGCVVVCGAAAGALDGVAAVALMAFGFAVAAALVVAVVSVLAGYAWVLTVAVLAACALGSVATVRLVRYGSPGEVFHRHPARPPRMAAPRQTALPVGSSLRALEAPKPIVQGVVIKETAERIVR